MCLLRDALDILLWIFVVIFLTRHRSAKTQCWKHRYIQPYGRCTLIVFILYCFAHARTHKPRTEQYCTNREFPVSIQVRGYGETGLYTLHDASYTAIYNSTRCLVNNVTHIIVSLLSSFAFLLHRLLVIDCPIWHTNWHAPFRGQTCIPLLHLPFGLWCFLFLYVVTAHFSCIWISVFRTELTEPHLMVSLGSCAPHPSMCVARGMQDNSSARHCCSSKNGWTTRWSWAPVRWWLGCWTGGSQLSTLSGVLLSIPLLLLAAWL